MNTKCKLVARAKDGSYKSCMVTSGYLKITYIPDKFVYAKPGALKLGYGLTYFESIARAKSFIAYFACDVQLWKIETADSIPLPNICWLHRINGISLKRFKAMPKYSCRLWPPGAHMAVGIKLVERIQ